MPEPGEIEQQIEGVEAELRRLETAYNLFFAGRLPRPPWEVRTQVENLLKRLDRTYIDNLALRFRLQGIQSRYIKFTELWDRGLRAREEGRPGPYGERMMAKRLSREQLKREEADADPERIVHVVAIGSPAADREKLGSLYQSLSDARREAGQPTMPYDRFEALVEDRVKRLQRSGAPEVAFRVTMKDGQPRLAARPLRGGSSDEGS